MKTYLIKNSEQLTDWFTHVHTLSDEIYPFTLQVFKGDRKHRSLEQNDLSHVWYREIANQGKQHTIDEVKRECKLTIGIPILRAISDEFRATWDVFVKNNPDASYEERLKLMDMIDVTSIMTTKQMSEYLDNLYWKYTQAGYHLELPKE